MEKGKRRWTKFRKHFRTLFMDGPHGRQEEKGHLRGTLSNPNFNHLAISQWRAVYVSHFTKSRECCETRTTWCLAQFAGHEWSCDHHFHRASQFANSPAQCRAAFCNCFLPSLLAFSLPLRPPAPQRFTRHFSFLLRAAMPPTLLATWFGMHLL